MTLQHAGRIRGKPFAMEDTGGLVCLDCLSEFKNAESFAQHVYKCPGPVGDRPADREVLPPGYSYLGGAGGYWQVSTPDGRVLTGPDNKKFHGKSDGADAAWDDAEKK